MKRYVFLFFMLIFFTGLAGCNGEAVKDPPEFVEMYLDDSATSLTSFADESSEVMLLTDGTDVTTVPSTTEPITTTAGEITYESSIYSDTDFQVVVVTNGENYDLLYSVELNDSTLGNCVYTDQSELYAATATIITESDGSYTTKIVLTIPASVEMDEYLSDRTISLSKILFTRDTVDGTFPADIPENTTTSLLFEIVATDYFDTDLGLGLHLNQGFVDVTLGPDYDYYDAAETLNMIELEIPASINGYDVGEIFLVDLYWVRDITILGTSSDIYLIGDFQALETITIDGPEYTSLTDHRTAIINGSFDSLIGVDIKNTNRYNLYLSYYEYAENPDYFTIVDSLTPHYNFPLLETVTIADSFLNYVKIGDDNLGYAFPSLDTVSVSGSITGNFTLGEESNQFDKLSTVSFSNSNVSSVTISGSKDALETPTALAIDDTIVSYDVSISGSVIGSIDFLNSTIGNLHIDDGEINSSVFQTLTFDNTLFDEDMGDLQIHGSHPELENLNLENVNPTTIKIGSVESVFANLTSINVESVDAWSLRIGDRDASFPMLQSITMNITDFEWSVMIGAENVTFPTLETISVEKTNAESFEIGYSVTDLSDIVLISCLDMVVNTSLSIRNSSEENPEATIVLTNVDSPAINISGNDWRYDLYLDDIDATNLSISTPGCEKIYLNLADVTTWEFYDYANGLSIPMETGVYSPIE